MAYTYRCPQCRTTSDPVTTRRAARAEGAWHRAREHSGHHPDGEAIEPVADEHATGVGGLLTAILIGCLIAAALARLIP
ncbi:hypothetical protein [Streptomyces sp. NPDC050428]|uniref:hypothetical protein n=1 Tax=Streptomyces sp. NPDC050428 TaxID=3155757 RepID=UPI00341C69CC